MREFVVKTDSGRSSIWRKVDKGLLLIYCNLTPEVARSRIGELQNPKCRDCLHHDKRIKCHHFDAQVKPDSGACGNIRMKGDAECAK